MWSSWDDWTTCSKTCGGGKRSSKRISNQPKNRNHGAETKAKPKPKPKPKPLLLETECPVEDVKEEECNVEICPGTY